MRKKHLHSEETCDILLEYFGGVAHLGERLNGIQEVVGSIPIISTTVKGTTLVVPFLFLQGPSGLETVWSGDAGSYRKKVLDNPRKV